MNQVYLNKIKKLQKEMMDTQKDIEQTSFYASAGGVVSVELKGTKEIVKVTVEESFEVESKEDLEMLGEMVVAACKQAYKEIDKTTEQRMAKFNELLGGFGGLF